MLFEQGRISLCRRMMGWDGDGGGDGFQRYGPNIMKRPAFFQSEALRLREPICRLQYCPYPKRRTTVLGRISRFLSPSLGAVVARLLLFSIFLFFSLNCETCNAFRWENVLPEKKRKWWNAHRVPALPEKISCTSRRYPFCFAICSMLSTQQLSRLPSRI